jgi:diaminopimelate decarboxylase
MQDIFGNWRSLVEEFGSPLYVYDLDIVEQRIQELKQVLPANSKLFYSLKANPLPAIAKAAATAGANLEVSSVNELKVACSLNFPTEKILYTGPGKTNAEIQTAIEAGVNTFSVESWADLACIENNAQRSEQKIRLLLRVNPITPLQGGLAMSGAPTQFGFEESVLLNGSEKLNQLSSWVELVGYHIYYGTQLDSEDTIVDAVSIAIDCVERLTSKLGFTPQILDLGGGFPWPFANQNQTVSLCNMRDRLEKVLSERQHSAAAEIWFESGRYLTASSGTLIATVLDIKEAKNNSRFVVLDTGINHLGGMSGLRRIPRGYVFIHNISAEKDAIETDTFKYERVSVVGPLCSPLDCLTPNTDISFSVNIGDIVAIPNVGAYGLTASLVAFLSRPAPMEIALRSGKVVELYTLRTGHERITIPNKESIK